MKLINLLFFLILLSCNGNKNYVCGDRVCIDKKEYNEYFADNLSIEIIADQKKKNKTVDLVKLNSSSSSSEKVDVKSSIKREKLRKKIEKEKLKKEKIRLNEERKIRKIEKKIKKKEEKEITKTLKSDKNEKLITTNNVVKKKKQIKKTVNKSSFNKNNRTAVMSNKIKSPEKKNICDDVKDCDIDKITELLIKKGKGKPFPKITSN
jgi:hypothetical protein